MLVSVPFRKLAPILTQGDFKGALESREISNFAPKYLYQAEILQKYPTFESVFSDFHGQKDLNLCKL